MIPKPAPRSRFTTLPYNVCPGDRGDAVILQNQRLPLMKQVTGFVTYRVEPWPGSP